MKAGQAYYIEGQHSQGGGAFYFGIGVEIEPADLSLLVDHPNLSRQEMSLRIHQTIEDRDTTELTVSGADGGFFYLAFWQDDADGWWFTEEIAAGCDADTLLAAIQEYYEPLLPYSSPIVEKTACRDFEGLDVDCGAAAETISDHVYEIRIPRSLDGPSCSQVQTIPTNTNATISVKLPASGESPAKVS